MEPKVETSLCDLLVDNMMKTNSWTDTDLIDELLTIFVGVCFVLLLFCFILIIFKKKKRLIFFILILVT